MAGLVLSFIVVAWNIVACSSCNLCEKSPVPFPWSKCNDPCTGHQIKLKYLLCCGNLSKSDCYNRCNVAESDLQDIRPCVEKCIHGTNRTNSHQCVCNNGFEGQCCQIGEKIFSIDSLGFFGFLLILTDFFTL